jgi:uncharacterized RmlC-like cupin family protein
MRPFCITLVLGVIGGVALLAQEAQSPQQTLTPKEIKWPAAAPAVGTSGAAGLQKVVLKEIPQSLTVHGAARLPPNTKILAHSHKDDRTAVVLSGVWHFGYGREFDEAALRTAGGFLYRTARCGALCADEDQKRLSKLQATDQPAGIRRSKNDPTKNSLELLPYLPVRRSAADGVMTGSSSSRPSSGRAI